MSHPPAAPPRTTPRLRTQADLLAAAQAVWQRRDVARTLAALEQAPEAVLGDAPALRLLGEALIERQAFAAAEAALRRSLALDPGSVPARLALGRLLHRVGRYAEAETALAEAAAHAPEDAAILASRGQVEIAQGRLDRAEALLTRAAGLRPDDPWPHLGLALCHFLRGDWAAAFPHYRWRRALPGAVPRPRPGDRLWAGEPLFGASILLYGEQGIGDTIQFLRYAPVLAAHGARVAVACPAEVLPVIPPWPGVQAVGGAIRRRFDYVSSLIDAADLLGVTLPGVAPAVPYLRAPARDPLPPPPSGTRLRVGICWAGSPLHSNDAARSSTVEPFLPLLAHPGVELVSLQVGPRAADLAAAGADSMVLDPSGRIADYGDTAAILETLDLVISVDTSVVHLAGALGRPVWVLLPFLPDWRWALGRADTPFYPTMRLFRQPAPGAWEPVFAEMLAAFAAFVAPLPPRPVAAAARAEADRQHALAMADLREDRHDAACAVLGRGLRAEADSAKIWNNLGVALRKRKLFAAAEAAFLRARAIEPSRGALGNLANTWCDMGRLAEARALQEELNADGPVEATSIYNYGIIRKNQGDPEAAIVAFEAAMALDPAGRDAPWDRSHELLRLGRWGEGWEGYEVRWALPDAGTLTRHAPIWAGQDPAGRTLLVMPEQGFGDTVFALRFLFDLKRRGARIVLQCQPELYRLARRLPCVDFVVPRDMPPPVPVDFQVAMMSLPRHALAAGCPDPARGRAYLAPDPGLDAFVSTAVPAGPLNIGIVWSGSATFRGNLYRRARAADFLGLAADPRVRLFSLQKGPFADELDQAAARPLITPLESLLVDFEISAALLGRLDAVIMTDSSVAHLAGALGRPVWVVLGDRPYWLWGQGERTPWYDSVRLVRRRPDESWGAAIARAGAMALAELRPPPPAPEGGGPG